MSILITAWKAMFESILNIQIDILENPSTWVKGWFFPWQIHLRCDDWLRGAIEPPEDCPPLTQRADWSKCKF